MNPNFFLIYSHILKTEQLKTIRDEVEKRFIEETEWNNAGGKRATFATTSSSSTSQTPNGFDSDSDSDSDKDSKKKKSKKDDKKKSKKEKEKEKQKEKEKEKDKKKGDDEKERVKAPATIVSVVEAADAPVDEVGKWLEEIGMEQYHKVFIEWGFDTILSLKMIDGEDLDAMGITILGHKRIILTAAKELANTLHTPSF